MKQRRVSLLRDFVLAFSSTNRCTVISIVDLDLPHTLEWMEVYNWVKLWAKTPIDTFELDNSRTWTVAPIYATPIGVVWMTSRFIVCVLKKDDFLNNDNLQNIMFRLGGGSYYTAKMARQIQMLKRIFLASQISVNTRVVMHITS